jgi:polar amino acid transport system substrate-binding protein
MAKRSLKLKTDEAKMKAYHIYLMTVISIILFVSTGYSGDIRVITEPTLSMDKAGRPITAVAEMTRGLMKKLDIPGEIHVYPWKRGYFMALNEPEIALFPTTRTETRENLFKWVGPILQVSWKLYANQNSTLKLTRLEDAMKVDRICGYLGDAKYVFLQKKGFKNLISRHSIKDCGDLLAKGSVDLWISTDNIESMESAKKSNFNILDIKPVYNINTKYLYFALSKDIHDNVVEHWQNTLNTMKMDGTLRKYYKSKYPDAIIQEISKTKDPILPWKTEIRK